MPGRRVRRGVLHSVQSVAAGLNSGNELSDRRTDSNCFAVSVIIDLASFVDEYNVDRSKLNVAHSCVRNAMDFSRIMETTILRSQAFWQDCLVGYDYLTLYTSFITYVNSQFGQLYDNTHLYLKARCENCAPCDVFNAITRMKLRINQLLLSFSADKCDGLVESINYVNAPVPDLLLMSRPQSLCGGDVVINGEVYYTDYNSPSIPHDLIGYPDSPKPPNMVRYIHITKVGGTVSPHVRYSHMGGSVTLGGYKINVPSCFAQPIIGVLLKKELCQQFIYPPALALCVPPHLSYIKTILAVLCRGIHIQCDSISQIESVSRSYNFRLNIIDDRYIVTDRVYMQLQSQLSPTDLSAYFTRMG